MKPELPEFNGWENWPTWCVNLWLTNDGPTYRAALAAVEGKSIRDAANAVKELVEEMTSTAPSGLTADLVGWVLCFVDWESIVEGLQE